MHVHLVDGTYELFRHHFALPAHTLASGQHVGAIRGVLGSLLQLLEGGATHVGVATDHVIESFRNALYAGYKTGEGIAPELHSQFHLLEQVLQAAGFAVFPMVEHEADDGLASAARVAAGDDRVERVFVCTPDKDLAQCVGGKVVMLDRRKNAITDRDGVIAKFGVPPESIPDFLALVGDTADGYPGLPGWGEKSAAAVLAKWVHVERIPDRHQDWGVDVRGAMKLADTLRARRDDALLFRTLATLDASAPTIASVDELRWKGPLPGFADVARALDAPRAAERADKLANRA